jgi:hypothetical protein
VLFGNNSIDGGKGNSVVNINTFSHPFISEKKGSPVHVAPSCVGSGEWSDHFRPYVRSSSVHLCKSLFSGTHDLMVTRQQLYRGLPFHPFISEPYIFPRHITQSLLHPLFHTYPNTTYILAICTLVIH